MTDEQRFFIQTLSDHLNGRETEARPGLDWDALLSCADSHQVSGILYQQCAAFLPASVSPVLLQRQATELFYYHNREALFGRIADALSEAEIPFFSVKGLEVARFYPVPALRTMGDCDIVVHPGDREAVHGIMTAFGFENTQKNDLEWMYRKDALMFEIHDRLLYDEAANTEQDRSKVDEVWDYVRPTGKGTRGELDWSFHFLFLLLHFKKHLIHSGVGFRQVMDLAVVLRRCALDWAWIEAQLDALGLRDFAGIVLGLLGRWFSADAPLARQDLSEAFCEEAAEKILSNGVFGFSDEANRDGAQMRRLAEAKTPLWLARISYLLKMLFPPYRNMRCVPSYALLDGRPWMLPAGWVYRFYHTLRYKSETGKHMIGNTFISNEKLDARQRELAKWGL